MTKTVRLSRGSLCTLTPASNPLPLLAVTRARSSRSSSLAMPADVAAVFQQLLFLRSALDSRSREFFFFEVSPQPRQFFSPSLRSRVRESPFPPLYSREHSSPNCKRIGHSSFFFGVCGFGGAASPPFFLRHYMTSSNSSFQSLDEHPLCASHREITFGKPCFFPRISLSVRIFSLPAILRSNGFLFLYPPRRLVLDFSFPSLDALFFTASLSSTPLLSGSE